MTPMKAVFIVLILMPMGIFSLNAQSIEGAWSRGNDELKITLILSGRFFSVAEYNLKNKKFVSNLGGVYRLEGDKLIVIQEFNSLQPDQIGKEIVHNFKISENNLRLISDKTINDYIRIDDGTPGQLSGAWLITGRVTGGKSSQITPGARKTMKILSGTRFQWIAYNSETKEFFGTGGGTYTTAKGKYTEHIEFFSRDNNRVGASLEFDFALEDGKWRHKGLSSKGDPIDEIWSRRESLGL